MINQELEPYQSNFVVEVTEATLEDVQPYEVFDVLYNLRLINRFGQPTILEHEADLLNNDKLMNAVKTVITRRYDVFKYHNEALLAGKGKLYKTAATARFDRNKAIEEYNNALMEAYDILY